MKSLAFAKIMIIPRFSYEEHRRFAIGRCGLTVVAHVARSGRSRTDAAICNWKGLMIMNREMKDDAIFAKEDKLHQKWERGVNDQADDQIHH